VELYVYGEITRADGDYGAEGFVYQQYATIPKFENRFATIGAWIVGDEPAGIGIREDATPITMNTSQFVPHYFV
jgi:glutathionylspermidine synthase